MIASCSAKEGGILFFIIEKQIEPQAYPAIAKLMIFWQTRFAKISIFLQLRNESGHLAVVLKVKQIFNPVYFICTNRLVYWYTYVNLKNNR